MRWLAHRAAAIKVRRSPHSQLNANDYGESCSRLDDNQIACICAKYWSIKVHYSQEVEHLLRIVSIRSFAGCVLCNKASRCVAIIITEKKSLTKAIEIASLGTSIRQFCATHAHLSDLLQRRAASSRRCVGAS